MARAAAADHRRRDAQGKPVGGGTNPPTPGQQDLLPTYLMESSINKKPHASTTAA
jgi:hypothetical protein